MPNVEMSVKWTGVLLLLLSGCATHFDRIQVVRSKFLCNQLLEANNQVDRLIEERTGERDVLMLDKAIIELANGHPKSAEKLLRQVRDHFDELEDLDAANAVASDLTDDSARGYPGEDYEKVLVRAMLSISNLMSGGGDADAYADQMVRKQGQIIQTARERSGEHQQAALAFKQVALGPYIRGMLAEESPLTLDDAVRARVQVVNWEPQFRDAKADLQRCQNDVAIRPGNGALFVFALVGRGPIKQEVCEPVTQVELQLADRLFDAFASRNVPSTFAPVKVPQIVNFDSAVDGVSVRIDGKDVGKTATIFDVGEMALRQQQAFFPEILARAVARRAVTKGHLSGDDESADVRKGYQKRLAMMTMAVGREPSESADTRCWGLLPDTIQVLRVELPAGEHRIVLRPFQRGGEFGTPAEALVTTYDGHNTYLLGNVPTSRFVGKLLTSTSE